MSKTIADDAREAESAPAIKLDQLPAASAAAEGGQYYQHHVFFCCNQRTDGRESCEDHGANALRDYCKGRIKKLAMTGKGRTRVNQAGCLDRCELGPVMVVYPEGIWYRYANQADVDEIIAEHLQQGRVVTRLQI